MLWTGAPWSDRDALGARGAMDGSRTQPKVELFRYIPQIAGDCMSFQLMMQYGGIPKSPRRAIDVVRFWVCMDVVAVLGR
jgi:hypothetical protein